MLHLKKITMSNEDQSNQQIDNFKHLGVNINNKNDIYRKISARIVSENR